MKIFFATYIDVVNPTPGSAAYYFEARIVRDEEGKVLYTKDWDNMLELCKDTANFFIDNNVHPDGRGYQIIDTENGCAIIDDERGYRIVTYDIHEFDLNIEVA
jgi:hypothetical protein